MYPDLAVPFPANAIRSVLAPVKSNLEMNMSRYGHQGLGVIVAVASNYGYLKDIFWDKNNNRLKSPAEIRTHFGDRDNHSDARLLTAHWHVTVPPDTIPQLVIDQLALKYRNDTLARIACEEYVQKIPNLPSNERAIYLSSVRNWFDQVMGPEIIKRETAWVTDSFIKDVNPITGGRIVKPEWQQSVRSLNFTALPYPATINHPAMAVYVENNKRGRAITFTQAKIHSEINQVAEALQQVCGLFGYKPENPLSCYIMDGKYLTVGGSAGADQRVVLAAEAGNLFSPGHTIKYDTAIHEFVHLVLRDMFKQHSVLNEFKEGSARGIEKILAGERNNKRYLSEQMGGITWNALQLLRSNPQPRNSATRMVDQLGQGNTYQFSYSFSNLVGVIYNLYPSSWLNIIKELYANTTSNLYDSQNKPLILNGIKQPNIQNREILHAALSKSILDLGRTKPTTTENQNILRTYKLGPQFAQEQALYDQTDPANFIEACAQVAIGV